MITPDRSTNTDDLSYVPPLRNIQTLNSTRSVDSASSQSSVAKIPKDAYSISKAMQQHGLIQDDQKAFERYPMFKQEIERILGADRTSEMKEKQIREFKVTHQRVQFLNEDTVLQNLLPMIIKNKYAIRKEPGGQDGGGSPDNAGQAQMDETTNSKLQDGSVYTTRLWSDDGLGITMNSEFRKTFLPNQYMEMGFEAELAKALAKSEGMKNPKPDFCYGLTPDTLPTPAGIMLGGAITTALHIAKGLVHPFLIVEGKSDQGETAQAQNQACRGGATLVHASRILYEKAGEPDISGADPRSVIFSVVMLPALMKIFVHWAEVLDSSVTYHMNRLATRCFEEDEQLRDLRRMLHNILNWGCNTRRNSLERLHKKIYHVQRTETNRVLEESKETKRRKLNDRNLRSTGSGD